MDRTSNTSLARRLWNRLKGKDGKGTDGTGISVSSPGTSRVPHVKPWQARLNLVAVGTPPKTDILSIGGMKINTKRVEGMLFDVLNAVPGNKESAEQTRRNAQMMLVKLLENLGHTQPDPQPRLELGAALSPHIGLDPAKIVTDYLSDEVATPLSAKPVDGSVTAHLRRCDPETARRLPLMHPVLVCDSKQPGQRFYRAFTSGLCAAEGDPLVVHAAVAPWGQVDWDSVRDSADGCGFDLIIGPSRDGKHELSVYARDESPGEAPRFLKSDELQKLPPGTRLRSVGPAADEQGKSSYPLVLVEAMLIKESGGSRLQISAFGFEALRPGHGPVPPELNRLLRGGDARLQPVGFVPAYNCHDVDPTGSLKPSFYTEGYLVDPYFSDVDHWPTKGSAQEEAPLKNEPAFLSVPRGPDGKPTAWGS